MNTEPKFEFCRIETVVTEFPMVFYTSYIVHCPERDALPANAFDCLFGKFHFKQKNQAIAFAYEQDKREKAWAEERAKAEAEARHFTDYIGDPVRTRLMRYVPGLTKDQIAVYGKLAPLEKLPEHVREAAARLGTWHVWDAKTSDGRVFRVSLDALLPSESVLQLV